MENPEYWKLKEVWYVVVDDLDGGWAISTIDLPLSEQNGGPYGWVGDFARHDVAEYVAKLHNSKLMEEFGL